MYSAMMKKPRRVIGCVTVASQTIETNEIQTLVFRSLLLL